MQCEMQTIRILCKVCVCDPNEMKLNRIELNGMNRMYLFVANLISQNYYSMPLRNNFDFIETRQKQNKKLTLEENRHRIKMILFVRCRRTNRFLMM